MTRKSEGYKVGIPGVVVKGVLVVYFAVASVVHTYKARRVK